MENTKNVFRPGVAYQRILNSANTITLFVQQPHTKIFELAPASSIFKRSDFQSPWVFIKFLK